MSEKKIPITRFAPSPTGDLHIGGVRTALFSWLSAKQAGGEFKLRIEDTDRERSTESSTKVILDGMQWLGLESDSEIIYQSQRFDIYNQVIDDMLQKGLAYYCWCTAEELDIMREQQKARGEKPRYNGKYRNGGEPVAGVNPVVRFKNPLEGEVSWNDKIRGNISISNQELDDFIIRRSDGTPTYNFCVVIDDHAQGVNLIIRGDDHISNTPRQINLYQALGWEIPEFAHAPMILGDDGKRLSKRHGATNVLDYRKEGYLPDAVINYLARLGWAWGDQEIFSRDELLKLFKITAVHSAPSTFNTEKLRWLNQQYLIKTPVEKIAQLLPEYIEQFGYKLDENKLIAAIPNYQERAKTLKEMAQQMQWISPDYEIEPEKFPEKVAAKAFKDDKTAIYLQDLSERLKKLDDFSESAIHQALEETVNHFGIGFGKIGQATRLAITAAHPSPDLAITLALAGKSVVINRLQKVIDFLLKN